VTTHWLVDLQIGGRIYRYAQQELDVTTNAGATLHYSSGLGALDLSGGSALTMGDASASFDVTALEDWALLASRGLQLDGGHGVIRRWTEGTTYERARVMLRGFISNPQYGFLGEPLSVTVSRQPRLQASQLPHPRMIVDSSTWSEPASIAVGVAYPVVIGAPGHTESSTPIPCVPVPQAQWMDPRQTTTETFTMLTEMDWNCPFIQLSHVPLAKRCYRTPYLGTEYELLHRVDWHTLFESPKNSTQEASNAHLIIHSRVNCVKEDTIRLTYDYIVEDDYTGTRSTVVWLGGHASLVRLEVVPEPGSEMGGDLILDYAPSTVTDLLGQETQAIERPFPMPGGNEGGIGSPTDSFYIGFRDDAVYGGGLKYRGDTLLRGAGDLLDYILTRHYSGLVDAARVVAAQGYLNRWKIDAWIEEPVNVWDWLYSEVLPLLPVEMRESADGVYPAVLRYDVTALDAKAHLQVDINAQRDGRITYTSDDVINEVVIKYRPVRDTWQAQRTVTAQAEYVSIGAPNQQVGEAWSTAQPGWYGEPDVRVLGNQRAALSQARFGLKSKEIKASALWDTASAVSTAQWLLDRYALPRRKVRYVVSEDRYDVGDVVLVTDGDVYLSAAVAIVADYTPRDGGLVALDLVLVES
jgi:hypothetical protein